MRTKLDIGKEAIRIGREYLADDVEKEIGEYAVFFTKPEIIQPISEPSVQDMLRICNLCVDLQIIRERCVLLFLDVRKARDRLKRLEKEFLAIPSVKIKFAKEKNKENREIFMYAECKPLALFLDRSASLVKQCEIVLDLLGSHVWTLKDNNKILSSVPHET